VFFGASSPGFRSFIPRMVRHDETARMMTAFGVVISFCPIISSLIFNTIFKATLTDWPGLVFLIAGILMFAVTGGQLFVFLFQKSPFLITKMCYFQNGSHADATAVEAK
jgi:MFS family permease